MKTFLLIRNEDNKVVGALNIRFNLPKKMEQFGGILDMEYVPLKEEKYIIKLIYIWV